MKGKVPFDKETGNMLGYAYRNDESYDWVDITKTFHTTLRYTRYTQGRSSVKFYFKDIFARVEYEMFIKEFDRIMKLGLLEEGFLMGEFGFVKKGANYGIIYLGGENDA